jgi:hypothetical protein
MRLFSEMVGVLVLLALMGNRAWGDTITNLPVQDAGMYPFAVDGRSNRGRATRFDIGTGTGAGSEGEGTLIKFDLRPGEVPVVPGGYVIKSAQLRLRSISSSSYIFIAEVVAYPLLASWQEGVGDSNPPGANFPWFPTSTNDAVCAYRSVTEVDMATNINAAYGTTWGTNLIARAGDAWGAFGGRGLGTDVANRKMIDQLWTKVGYPAGTSLPVGNYFPPLTFTAEGVKVLNEWAKGTLPNHGFNVWGKCPLTDAGGRFARIASRESAYDPELVLVTGPDPRVTLILLR